MSYREPTLALRAELQTAEARIEEQARSVTALEQKLERAEAAVAAYRGRAAPAPAHAERAAWMVMAISVLSWMSSVVAVMQDQDGLGSHLAAAAALVSWLSPLIVHAAAGSLLVGGVGLFVRLGAALFITSTVTIRSAADSDSWYVLFWLGPSSLALGAVLECSLLIRRARASQ